MIKYPITNRDLLRSIMNQVPAAGVRFSDPVLQEFAEDQQLGMCIMEIKKLPEVRTVQMIYNPDGTSRPHTTTVQQHEVWVHYHNPELEFEKRLSI